MPDAPILSDDKSPSTPSARTLRGGDPDTLGRIDHYDLLRKLGGGGFGVVYLARDSVSGVEVAIKTLHPLLKHNEEAVAALRERFKLVSRLAHPNIATALVLHPCRDINLFDETARSELKLSPGDSVMVMRYAPGVTLDRWRQRFEGGIVPLDQTIAIARQMADALDYAHSEKVLHRDISPRNIMVETMGDGEPRVRLLDFGLASELRSSLSRVSGDRGGTSGTRPYMAPEVWRGRKQDGRTDQYSLACVLYEMLTGAPPFGRVFRIGDPAVERAAVENDEPYVVENVPARVNEAFARALAKGRHARFSSCRAFIEAFAGIPAAVRPLPRPAVAGASAEPAPSPSAPPPAAESTAPGSENAELEASVLARRRELSKRVADVPSRVRSDAELGALVRQARSEMEVAEDAIRLGRFAAADLSLSRAKDALDSITTTQAARAKAAEEARRKAAEEAAAKKKAQEEARRKAAAEAAAKKKAEEEARRKAAEEAAAKRKAEEVARCKAAAEAAAKKKAQEEARRKAAAEAAAKKKAEEEARRKAAAEAAAKKKAEEEARRKAAAEAAARKKAEEAARREREALEKNRLRAEKEAKARAEAEKRAAVAAARREARVEARHRRRVRLAALLPRIGRALAAVVAISVFGAGALWIARSRGGSEDAAPLPGIPSAAQPPSKNPDRKPEIPEARNPGTQGEREEPHAESAERAEVESHAESAEGAEVESHAESAESTEVESRAETAEGAEVESHAESAESTEVESRAETAEGTEVEFHAETAERAEVESHAESAEGAESERSSPSAPLSPVPASLVQSAATNRNETEPGVVLPDGIHKETVDGIEWTFRIENSVAGIGTRMRTGGSLSTIISLLDPYTTKTNLPLGSISTDTAGGISIPARLGGVPVVSIGPNAFLGCSNLTSVAIPASVTSVDRRSFLHCSNLSSFLVDEDNSLFCGRDGLLLSKDGSRLIRCPPGRTGTFSIPDGVTEIGDSAFFGCFRLTSIEIPASVMTIDDKAFGCFIGCSRLTKIGVSDRNGAFASKDGVLFSKDGKNMIRFPEGKRLEEYEIPGEVRNLKGGAFAHCSYLKRISVESAVTNMGFSVFGNCPRLERIVFEGDCPSGFEDFGDNAVRNRLGQIQLPSGKTSATIYVHRNAKGWDNKDIPGLWFHLPIRYADEDPFPIDLGSGVSLEMVACPGIASDFWMGKFEVTQEQWHRVMGGNPSRFKGAKNPVEQVSWNDCQEFIRKLNELPEVKASGLTFRLPTEEEWETACRAGEKGDYFRLADGTEISAETLGRVAWFDSNSNRQTHPVGEKEPNAWGLYDMHGNVEEWTETADGEFRVLRGGSWFESARGCGSSSRGLGWPSGRSTFLGFRLCASGRPTEAPVQPEATAGSSEGEQAARSAAASRSEKGFNGILNLGSGVSLEMVHCPGVAPDFWMGKFEITQEQWQRVMGGNPSHFKGAKNPVETVSWNDCQDFIRKLNALPAAKASGLTFRLPTEKEWETACRAGAPKSECYCKLADGTQITESNLPRVAWFGKNWEDGPTKVGKNREPNAWGLYDMHGNVWEWTQTADGVDRVYRGGCFDFSAVYCTAGIRFRFAPDYRYGNLGFRLVASGRADKASAQPEATARPSDGGAQGKGSQSKAEAEAKAQAKEARKAEPERKVDVIRTERSPSMSRSASFTFQPTGKATEEWAKLDRAQKADINRLGTTLVDFAIERDRRIEKNQFETMSRLLDVREPAEKRAREEYIRARDARIRAGSALSALKNEREIAERHLAEAQKRLVEAEKGKADVTRRIEHADEYIRDIGRDIARTREEAESAGRDLFRAKNDFQGRKDALAQAKTAADEAKKDRDAKKTAADAAAKRAEDAKTAAEAAAKRAEDAKTAAETAEKYLADTRKAEAAAAGALASAEGQVDRLAKRMAAADRAMQDATASLNAAKAALEETRKKAAEPKGWFARHLVPGWFQPSVPRAERRVEAAVSAVAGQVQAVRDAKAALKRAKEDLEEAGRNRARAEDYLAKAGAEFGCAKAAAESKAEERKEAEADSARAKKALSVAEGAVVSAETKRAEAEAAVGEAEKGLAKVRAKAGELEKAKGPAEQAAIIYRDSLADAEKAVIDARRKLEERQAAVDNLGERGAELNRKQADYEGARNAEEDHRLVWEKARRELDNVRADAIRLVAEDESKAQESNKRVEDDFWNALEKRERTVKVPILQAEFDAQVKRMVVFLEKARKAQGAAEESERKNMPIRVRKTFQEQSKKHAAALDRWRKARMDLVRSLQEKGTNVRGLMVAYDAARKSLSAAHEEFLRVEEEYNRWFNDFAWKTDSSLSDKDADARYSAWNALSFKTDGRRNTFSVRGDRRWLARTGVDGRNLLDTLLEEFVLAAESLVERGEAKRDSLDPTLVLLSRDQAVTCARKAAERTKNLAIYGGFFLCGIDVNTDDMSIWVDKGRFCGAVVSFWDANDDVRENGVHLSRNEILSELCPLAPEKAMEGETFNFYDLVKRLRTVDSFRHVRGLDARLEVSSDFEYRYDSDDGFGIEDPDTHDTMTRAVSLSVRIGEKGLWESKGMFENAWLNEIFDGLFHHVSSLQRWTPSVFVYRQPLRDKFNMPPDRW